MIVYVRTFVTAHEGGWVDLVTADRAEAMPSTYTDEAVTGLVDVPLDWKPDVVAAAENRIGQWSVALDRTYSLDVQAWTVPTEA